MQDRIGEALSIYARATVRQTASTSGGGGAEEEREEYLLHSFRPCLFLLNAFCADFFSFFLHPVSHASQLERAGL